METTRLSSKGQIILPKSLREAHQWIPGTEFIVEDTPQGVLLRPGKPFAPSRLEEVAGRLSYSGKAKSVAEMEQAVVAEVKDRRARGRY